MTARTERHLPAADNGPTGEDHEGMAKVAQP
jgi:hypothetical protein